MKIKTALTLFSLALGLAFAGLGSPAQAADLSAFTNQSSWSASASPIAGYGSIINVYSTDRKTARLGVLPERLSVSAAMTLPSGGHSFEAWSHYCASETDMSISNMLKHSFTLRASVNPAPALVNVTAAGYSLAVENPLKLTSMAAKVTFLVGAITDPRSESAIEANMMSQVQSQRAGVIQNGSLLLTFTGMDDLACDLMTGKAWIGFIPTYVSQAAEATRTALITPERLQQVYACVQSTPSPLMAINSATLTSCIGRDMQASAASLGTDKYMGLLTVLFGAQGTTLQSIDDFAFAASSLDDVSVATLTQSPVISQSVQLPGDNQ